MFNNIAVLGFALSCPEKNRLLSNLCIGALVIGGGTGTLQVIQQLLSKHRMIVAIHGSGGITRQELPQNVPTHPVIVCHDIQTAINKLCFQ